MSDVWLSPGLTFRPYPAMMMMMIKRFAHAVQMRPSRQHHEQVKDLVRAAPDVESCGEAPFGPARRVEERAKDVHHAMCDYPAETHLVLERPITIYRQSVDDGDDAREAKGDKHESAKWAPLGSPKVLKPGDQAAAQAEEYNLGPVRIE